LTKKKTKVKRTKKFDFIFSYLVIFFLCIKIVY